MTDLSDDEAQAAKDILAAAIQAYYHALYPGDFISDWTLLAHRRSIELEQDGRSALSTLTPTGQDWLMTRGMLHAALDTERFGG